MCNSLCHFTEDQCITVLIVHNRVVYVIRWGIIGQCLPVVAKVTDDRAMSSGSC